MHDQVFACWWRRSGTTGLVRSFALALIALAVIAPPDVAEAQSRKLWKALATGQAIALMRHARAPGKKDSPNINLYDCSTQRNLSSGGRAQARRTGAYFRKRGIRSANVFSSAWCRCKQTAQLLGFGGVSVTSTLNALAKGPTAQAQTSGLAALIRNASTSGATILVTHKTNIKALTGITPASGETLIVNRSSRVIGRIPAR